MTNDAWWGTTPGHRQLLSYTKLRAIETRLAHYQVCQLRHISNNQLIWRSHKTNPLSEKRRHVCDHHSTKSIDILRYIWRLYRTLIIVCFSAFVIDIDYTKKTAF